MTAPERSLPPDSQAWGRYVEERIAELNKRIGVAASAAKAANARTAGAARSAAEATERAVQLEQSQTSIVQEVIDKDESAWAPVEPEAPQHNHHWYDVLDGNVLKIRADYGAYERVNYVRNPSFRHNTDGWTALGGELATTSDDKGHISASTGGAAAIVETEGRAVVIDLPATDDGGTGEGASPAGQIGALWTASAELELVESSISVTAVLEVIDSNDVPVATSGPVVLAYGVPTRVTARPQEAIEGTMDEVRVALSLVNNDEPNFEVTVDDVILEAADYGDDEEQQYFDGSMPGVFWQGDDSYSTSWWDGLPRWIEAQDEKLKNEFFQRNEEIAEDLERARESLAAAGSLIEAVRDRVGRKMWAGETFDEGDFTWTPLGGGKIRFEAAGEDISGWEDLGLGGPTLNPDYASGATWEATVSGPGIVGIGYWHGAGSRQTNITITSEMMDPDYGWVDMDLNLEDLAAEGGPLDPDVIAELWEQVVAAGFLVATEAIVGPQALIDGAVTARAMNVVHEASDGGRLSIQPDGVRMWRVGNDGPNPNVMLTTGTGFRVQANDGAGLMWIDPATGNLRTAGNIISGGQIIGSSFAGGSIGITAPNGEQVFTASPSGGVTIGGEGILFESSFAPVNFQSMRIPSGSSAVPASPNRTYRVRLRIERDAALEEVLHDASVQWQNAAGQPIGLSRLASPHSAALIGQGEPIDIAVVAPAGAARFVVFVAHNGVTGQGTTLLTDFRATLVGAGDVSVGGTVKGATGNFGAAQVDVLEAGKVRGFGGIEWDPSDSGWLPFDLATGWLTAAGNAAQRRKRGDYVDLRGEVVKVNAGGGTRVTTLPAGWRPAQRIRGRGGWGAPGSTGDGWYQINTNGEVSIYDFSRTSSPGFSLGAIPPFSTI